jgi:hypothetical protein
VYGEVSYAAQSWDKSRRIIIKAEQIPGKSNPRFVVTSLSEAPQHVYEKRYCARGDMENRIFSRGRRPPPLVAGGAAWVNRRQTCADVERGLPKAPGKSEPTTIHPGSKEQQLGLFADRTSSTLWWANQLRLLLSSLAYVLIETIRRVALRGTHLANAQVWTLLSRDGRPVPLAPAQVRRQSPSAARHKAEGGRCRDAQYQADSSHAVERLSRPETLLVGSAAARCVAELSVEQSPSTRPWCVQNLAIALW